MNQRILIVGCGFPQLGLLRFCRTVGLDVVGLDANPRAVGAAFCDHLVVASTTDARAIAQAVVDHSAVGVTTCGSEHAVLPTARAAEQCGLPFYLSSEVIAGCQHKDDMRRLYAEGGAPSPFFAEVASVDDAHRAVAKAGLPVVVKPARGWGQRGVSVVREASELSGSIERALESARVASGRAIALVEGFIEGLEYSVDAYTVDGVTEVLAVTERIITHYPEPPGITFAEVYPSGLDASGYAAVCDAAVRGAAALGVTRGPTYTQVRHGAQGAYIVETALRLGGGLDPDVTLLASGVSLYRRLVGVALGRLDWEQSRDDGPRYGGAVGRFIVGQPGRVLAVEGLEDARRLPGVVDAQVFVGIDDIVRPLTDGAARAGCVLAHGRDRDDAEANARRAMERIVIRTEAT